MSKSFRCGRVMLTKDGTIKKLNHADGGGSRRCEWNQTNMTFHDAHNRVLNLFQLNDRAHQTSLCDFQYRPIDVEKYTTFREYIDEHGLIGNSTAVYLCTREGWILVSQYPNHFAYFEVDGIDKPRISTAKKRKELVVKTTRVVQKTSTQEITNSYKRVVRNETVSDRQEIHQSLPEYSFKNAINDLIKNVGDLIKENSFDEILSQLLGYICLINGYVCSTIDQLKQQIQQSKEYYQSEITFYSNNLTNVCDICQSTKTLLDLNKSKFDHLQIFSTITNSFTQFHEHLKTLRNQWLEHIETNRTSFSSSSTITSTSSHSNIQPSSQNHPQTNLENSRQSFQVLPSSSSQQLSNERTNEQNLFQPFLSCLRYLLTLLTPEHLSTFRLFVQSSIKKIESVQISINLYDEQSICNGKRIILSIKNEFYMKFNGLSENRLNHDLNRQLNTSSTKIFRAIELLFISLDNYQLQIHQKNRSEDSHWSSPPRLSIDQRQSECRYSTKSNKRKVRDWHDK